MRETVRLDTRCPWCGESITVEGKADDYPPDVAWQACNCSINLDSWPSIVEAWQWEAGQ